MILSIFSVRCRWLRVRQCVHCIEYYLKSGGCAQGQRYLRYQPPNLAHSDAQPLVRQHHGQRRDLRFTVRLHNRLYITRWAHRQPHFYENCYGWHWKQTTEDTDLQKKEEKIIATDFRIFLQLDFLKKWRTFPFFLFFFPKWAVSISQKSPVSCNYSPKTE